MKRKELIKKLGKISECKIELNDGTPVSLKHFHPTPEEEYVRVRIGSRAVNYQAWFRIKEDGVMLSCTDPTYARIEIDLEMNEMALEVHAPNAPTYKFPKPSEKSHASGHIRSAPGCGYLEGKQEEQNNAKES